MRISTSQFLLGSLNDLLAQESSVNQLNREISTGQSLLDAGSDPVAAGQSIGVASVIGQLTYDTANAAAATRTAQTGIGALQQVTTILSQLRQTAVQAASAGTPASDRQSLTASAQNALQQLLGLANTQDTNGSYIFGGSKTDTTPFTQQPNGQVVFNGDAAANKIEVAPSLTIPSGLSGQNVFVNIAAGNGGVAVGASSTNAGTAYALVQGLSSVSQVAAERLSGAQFDIAFSSNIAGGLDYTVTSGSGAPGSAGFSASSGVVASGHFAPGSDLSFGGVQLAITGNPAAGDSFTVQTGAAASIFDTVQNLIAALQLPPQGQTGGTQGLQQIENVIANLSGAQTSILSAQALLGSRLTEIQALQGQNSTAKVSAQGQLSDLQSANLPQVMANYSASVTALQAAQLAFARVQNLTLFSVIHS